MHTALWTPKQEAEWQQLAEQVEHATAERDTAFVVARAASDKWVRALNRSCWTRKPKDLAASAAAWEELQATGADADAKAERAHHLVRRQIALAEPRYIAVYCGGRFLREERTRVAR